MGGVRRLTQLYGWVTVTTARRNESLAGGIVSGLLVAMITATLGFLWQAALPNGETIAGYDAGDMVWYLAIAETVVTCVDARLMLRIGTMLQNDELTTDLLRPAAVAGMLIAREYGSALVRASFTFPLCALVALAMGGAPPGGLTGLGLMLVAAPLAVMAKILFIIAASSSALWVGDTTAAWMVLQKIVFLAGGMLAPLEFWPPLTERILIALPFASMAYTPARVAVHADVSEALELIALQLWWIAVLALVVGLAWRSGIRRIVRVSA
jgi:ABC-2 type transport system permease protein